MRQSKKNILMVLGAILLLLLLTLGVYFSNVTKKKTYHIVYIPKVIDSRNDFWTSLIAGARMAATDEEVEFTVWAGKTEEDYEGQNKLILEALEEKPDAILVSPCSYEKSTEILKQVRDAGITLGFIDSVVDEEVQDFVVATDNFSAGKKLGEFAAKQLESGDKAVIIGHVKGASTAIDREAGIRAGLGEKSACIQEVVYCGSEYSKATSLAGQMILKYPDLKMIIGLNEYSAVGAARGVNDRNMKEKIKMVGFDSSLEEIQLMEAGVFGAICIQKPFNMGYLGVEQAVKILDGKRVQDVVDSGSKLITVDNLYEDENQKLLFPFVDNSN